MGEFAANRGMTSPILEKLEEPQHGENSSGSIASTPEAEGHDQEQLQAPGAEQQPQKRKGGRKPIYATSEERKQRNRQAQAAFRERRTEYIKQLESQIKIHEETLHNLQHNHRTTSDECLMLRYKNSLLERILLEKGIDVQAELRAKGGSPSLGPTRMPVSAAPLSQPIRYAVNKYAQNRRSLTGLQAKADGVSPTQAGRISPNIQPTPASRISSPTVSAIHRSPNFVPQSGPMSPSFGPTSQQMRPQQPLRPHFNAQPARPPMPQGTYTSSTSTINGAMSSGSGPGPSHNPNHNPNQVSFYGANFQNHYDQLEQEYDEDNEMYEDESPQLVTSAGAYQTGFQIQGHGMQQQAPTNHQQQHMASNGGHDMQPPSAPLQSADANGQFATAQGYDHYDPMLDADPFGLSASMRFPTQFSTFDASNR